MLKLVAFFICCVALTNGQCPADGKIDANAASAATLASLMHLDPAAATRMTDEIRRAPLMGYTDLRRLSARYPPQPLNRSRVDTGSLELPDFPEQLVVCAPPEPAGHADSIDPDQDRAVNVNSASENELSSLRSCGVTTAEIHTIALANQKSTRFNQNSLRTFLAGHTPPQFTSSTCKNLTFRYNSR